MTDKVGRNDLCPCGSGLKYKKCCLKEEKSDIVFIDSSVEKFIMAAARVIEDDLWPYTINILSEDDMINLYEKFCPFNMLEFYEIRHGLFNVFFVPWVLFKWIPDRKLGQFDSRKTIAQNYLETHAAKLSKDEKTFLTCAQSYYYSFYSVIEIVDEVILARDILLGVTQRILSFNPETSIEKGDIIFSGLLFVNEQQMYFISELPFIIDTRYNTKLIKFREELILLNNGHPLGPEVLRTVFSEDVLYYAYSLLAEMQNLYMTKTVNSDGDAIKHQSLYFTLDIPIEEAVAKLLPLTLGKSTDALLKDAKRGITRNIKEVAFPWKRVEKCMCCGELLIKVMGTLAFKKGLLILEVNSEKRALQGKNLLEQYLAGAIDLLKIVEHKHEAVEELVAASQNIFENWQELLEKPIPDLDFRTPKDAVMTPEGKELLEAWLLRYENTKSIYYLETPFLQDFKKALGLVPKEE